MKRDKDRVWVDRAINVERAKRLFEAGFPVCEIAYFLRLPESTIRSFKADIDKAEEIKKSQESEA